MLFAVPHPYVPCGRQVPWCRSAARACRHFGQHGLQLASQMCAHVVPLLDPLCARSRRFFVTSLPSHKAHIETPPGAHTHKCARHTHTHTLTHTLSLTITHSHTCALSQSRHDLHPAEPYLSASCSVANATDSREGRGGAERHCSAPNGRSCSQPAARRVPRSARLRWSGGEPVARCADALPVSVGG
jgi:hypothetical protein